MTEKTIYHERVLEHYRHSKHKGTLENPSFTSGVYNPSCGDSITIQGIIESEGIGKSELITACKFQSEGCVISTAAASLLCEYAIGKKKDELIQCSSQTMIDLIQLPLGPTRLRCALISLEALQKGLSDVASNKVNT